MAETGWTFDFAFAGAAHRTWISCSDAAPPGDVLFYRHILGSKMAGQPGHAPYPTYYHPVIGRERLCHFLGEFGVKCVGSYGDGFRREGSGVKRIAVRLAVQLTSILSFGTLTADDIDLLYIAVKELPAESCGG